MCVIWEKLAHCKVIHTKYYESSNQINLEVLLFWERLGHQESGMLFLFLRVDFSFFIKKKRCGVRTKKLINIKAKELSFSFTKMHFFGPKIVTARVYNQ